MDQKQVPENIYEQNWGPAEYDPELFISTFISPDINNPLAPTTEQLRFMKAMLSGKYDEGWFAGGNSSGKTWTAKFMALHWSMYKIKPNHDPFISFQQFSQTPYSILCTGPENKQAMELWSAIEEGLKASPILKHKVENITVGTRRSIHPKMELTNGVVIEAVGLHDKGKHVEGQTYDLILVNEPADVRHLTHIYERVLVPRMWRRGGILAGFGTPKGKNEYYNLWRRGRKELE